MSTPKKKVPNIDPRPNGEWRVRVKGFPARQFAHLSDAEAHRDKLKRARSTGSLSDPNADLIALRALAAEHFAANGASLAQRTWDSYAQQWKSNVLTHHVADMPIRMLSPSIIEGFRDDLLARGVGPASVRRTLTIMQTVLERGVAHKGLVMNPVKVVKKPTAKRAGTIVTLSPAQVEAMRREVKGADKVLLAVLAYSGLRPEEARAVTWGDVQTRTIVVDKAAEPDGTVKGTKTERNRTVRLLGALRDDLAQFRVASGSPPDSALIFPRADGSAWTESDYRNWRKRVFRKAATGAGLTIKRPYDLRHTAASLWLHGGAAPVRVANWLGHSVATLSGTYAHVIEDLEDEDSVDPEALIRAARQDNVRTTFVVLSSPDESGAAVAEDRGRAGAAG